MSEWKKGYPTEEGNYLCTPEFSERVHEYYYGENDMTGRMQWWVDEIAFDNQDDNGGFVGWVDPEECMKAWMEMPKPYKESDSYQVS